MYRKHKKLLILSGSLILISSIFLLKIDFWGDKHKAAAQTIMCEETLIVGEGEDAIETNALEVPIGKAVDQAEYLADEIAARAREMIAIIPSQIQASNDITSLAQQCGVNYCSPDCREEKEYYDCECRGCLNNVQEECERGICGDNWYNQVCCCDNGGCNPPCGFQQACWDNESNQPGECAGCDRNLCCCKERVVCESYPCQNAGGADRACPSGIPSQVPIIDGYASDIFQRQTAILSLFGQFGSPNSDDRDLVMPKLEESRQKLFECVVTPGEAAAVLRGDTSGKWLVSCDSLLAYFISVHSYLPFRDGAGNIITPEELQQDCYGNTYCDALGQWGAVPPYDDPCANDYYCCFISP